MVSFNWGYNPNPTGGWGTGGVSAAADLNAGDVDWAQMRSPEQDWQQFMLSVAPGMNRAPMNQMRDQLMSRYALAQPYNTDQSFAGFLAAGPDPQADYATLRNRARSAADVAGYSQDTYANKLMELGGPGTEEGRRLALLGATFNPLQGGSTGNQAAIANMLAAQRGPTSTGAAGGRYQGGVGDAIQRAMSSMYTARQARGYDPNTFLDWYMNMTAPPATA